MSEVETGAPSEFRMSIFRDGRPFGFTRPPIIPMLIFYLAYVAAGGLGQGLKIIPGAAITFWPPAGIFVATLLLTPRRTWPFWAATAACAELTANVLWFHNSMLLACVYFSANALEALAAALLIDRFARRPFQLETLSDVGAFALLGAVIAPMVGATVIATTDAFIGKHDFVTAWLLIWLGDGSGLMVSTPLTLSLVEMWRARSQMPPARIIEAGVLGFILVAAGAFAFRSDLATPYVMLPALVWIAVRFQVAGTAAALALVVLLAAVAATWIEPMPPTSTESVRMRVLELQAFLVVAGISTLIVAVLSLQHRKSQERLKLVNDELEKRVGLRTAALRASETRWRDAAKIAKLATYRWKPGTDEIVWDDRLKAMFGLGAADPVTPDTWRKAIHPDDLEVAQAAFARSLDPSGDGTFECEYRVIGKTDGVERWVAARGQVVFEHGQPVDFIGTALDTTERKNAEDALRRSELEFRTMANAAPAMVWVADANWAILHMNDRWQDYTGESSETAQGFGWTNAVHPDDLGRMFSQWRLCRDARTHYESECRYRRSDGAYRWHTFRALPQLAPDGSIAKWFGVGFDIHDQEMSQRATAQLAAIVTASSDAILGLTLDGTVTSWNEGAEHIYGYSAEEMLGRHVDRIVPEDLKVFETEVLARVAAGERIANLETVRLTRDGRQLYISLSAAPVRDADGSIIGISKISRDITERRLLMKEINHRAKNMLGLVQAIARQTVTSSPRDFLDRFLDRLQALAANHDLLVRSEWKGVDMKTLLRAQLAPFADLIGRRIRLKGARVRLTSNGAQAIGMALHELATNAGKYGALSSERGIVDIAWTLDCGRFKMHWIEMNGPPVVPPARQGFGSTVVTTLTKMSTNGSAEIVFAPAGVEWRLDCPVSEVVEASVRDDAADEESSRTLARS